MKNVKNIKKSTEKRQIRGITSGSRPAFACQPALRSRQNMKKTCLLFIYRRCFIDFSREITERGLKLTKKVENG